MFSSRWTTELYHNLGVYGTGVFAVMSRFQHFINSMRKFLGIIIIIIIILDLLQSDFSYYCINVVT